MEDNIKLQFGANIKKNRLLQNLSQEDLANLTNLHRTYIGGIERGERNLSLQNIEKIANALNLPIIKLFDIYTESKMRKIFKENFYDDPILNDFGLSLNIIESSIHYVYQILDEIDSKLMSASNERLADLVELANLSAIIGNLYRGGIVSASKGNFKSNLPHTFPDVLACNKTCKDFEIKVALESNSPKGHLVKPGLHLIIRYVLCDENGIFTKGKQNRGKIVYIWEIKVGYLKEEHFSTSNTAGDRGKTAVINAAGLKQLKTVFLDKERAPVKL